MAEELDVSKNTVNSLWQMHNIKPHLSRTFKLSRDADMEKLTDVVGLYMNRPTRRWCCAWMKRARSKKWIGLNRGYH